MHFLENNLNFYIEFTILTIELSFCTHKLFKVCRQVVTPKRHQLFHFVDVINKSLSIGLIFIIIELYLLVLLIFDRLVHKKLSSSVALLSSFQFDYSFTFTFHTPQ